MGGFRFNPDAYLGKRYGKYTVIGRSTKRYHVQVKCDCGVLREVSTGMLKSGRAVRCQQCYFEEVRGKNGPPCLALKVRWHSLRKANALCQEWQEDFQAFVDAVLAAGGSIDRAGVHRIDPDKAYGPGNIYVRHSAEEKHKRLERLSEALAFLGIQRTTEQLAALSRQRRYQLLLHGVSLPGEVGRGERDKRGSKPQG